MANRFKTVSLNQILPGFVYQEPRFSDEVPFLYNSHTRDHILLTQVDINRILPGFVYRKPIYDDEVPMLISRSEGILVPLY